MTSRYTITTGYISNAYTNIYIYVKDIKFMLFSCFLLSCENDFNANFFKSLSYPK